MQVGVRRGDSPLTIRQSLSKGHIVPRTVVGYVRVGAALMLLSLVFSRSALAGRDDETYKQLELFARWRRWIRTPSSCLRSSSRR